MNIVAHIIFALVFTLGLASCGVKKANYLQNKVTSTSYNKLSEEMLMKLKEGKSVKDIQEKLASIKMEDLTKSLVNDNQRMAFWINIYNAYIIAILKEQPNKFIDRASFFTTKQIRIAEHDFSFDDIENGIIRKSQFKFGLGYIRKVFPPKTERKLRVSERDYRIHFALNCGAKSCPPVRIYKAEALEKQLQEATKSYLTEVVKYQSSENKVMVSPLMSWFRGDFGGKKGVLKILKDFKLIPQDKKPQIDYADYSWELDINNYAE
ncbi:DUF547 domain-containing protein [Pedobacter glucosidilyticus]|uniref:DUF547 domain-containing protein n=1 Tax=Pedobacter glucosidilyticus TaxID=1122941 RepID=UPI0003FB0C2C|nr:DUF547 domain-containing protein [Pedobacter glucosidilyticus]